MFYTEVNVCASQTCQNGGTCVPLYGTFFCRCQSRYAGNNCERCESLAFNVIRTLPDYFHELQKLLLILIIIIIIITSALLRYLSIYAHFERFPKDCARQTDVVFVLDFSGSIEYLANWYDLLVQFTQAVIVGLDVDNDNARVAVVTFANNSNVVSDLRSSFKG